MNIDVSGRTAESKISATR